MSPPLLHIIHIWNAIMFNIIHREYNRGGAYPIGEFTNAFPLSSFQVPNEKFASGLMLGDVYVNTPLSPTIKRYPT